MLKKLIRRKKYFHSKEVIKYYMKRPLQKPSKSIFGRCWNLNAICWCLGSLLCEKVGYPRKDTCSTCDVLKVVLATLETKLPNCSDDLERKIVAEELEKKSKENMLHLKKAESFYSLKRKLRKYAQKSHDMRAPRLLIFRKICPAQIYQQTMYIIVGN